MPGNESSSAFAKGKTKQPQAIYVGKTKQTKAIHSMQFQVKSVALNIDTSGVSKKYQ